MQALWELTLAVDGDMGDGLQDLVGCLGVALLRIEVGKWPGGDMLEAVEGEVIG